MSSSLIKRLCSLVFLIITFASICYSQKDNTQISLFGGFNRYMQYGSSSDYAPGTNDFPVKPSHSTLGIGCAARVFLSDRMAFEMEGRLASSTKVRLEDPSDQDSFEMNTSKHFSVSANFVYQIPHNKIRPYFFVGMGLDKIFAEEEIYISDYGYEVFSSVPLENDLLDPLVQAGVGLVYFFSKDLGMRADLRYVAFFQGERNINSVTATIGIVLDL